MPSAFRRPDSVCVYCGSSNLVDPRHLADAESFGKDLAANGMRLVYGGGGVGLMGAVARAAHDAGGRVLGIMPEFLRSREILYDEVETIIVPNMHERKMIMFQESDAFVVLPGGIGTLEEIVELLSWRRLDLHGRPNSQLGDAGGDPDPADAVRVVRESKAAALVGDHRVFAAIGRQRDGHPFQTRLGWPLQAIAIGIDPHPIADLDDRISCHRARHDGHAHDVTTVGELHQVARGRTDGSGHVSGGYARCLHPAGPARKVIDHVRAVAGVGGDDRCRLADGNGRHAMPSRCAGDELRRARTRCARRRPLLVGQPASVLLGLLRRRCLATKIAFRCVLGGTCHTCQQLRSSGVHCRPLDLADLVAIVHDPGRGNAGGTDPGALDTLTGS